MSIRSTLLRLANAAWRIGASLLLAGHVVDRLDGGFTDWRTWLNSVAFGFSLLLFWGGVGRVPLPRLPRGFQEWFASQRREEWNRRNADRSKPVTTRSC